MEQAGEENCPPGSYICSIHGRTAERVDSLGIRCRKVGQTGISARRDAHGGLGGHPFDDVSPNSDSSCGRNRHDSSEIGKHAGGNEVQSITDCSD